MSFKEFVERWCIRYVPMSHTPGRHSENPRFFFVEGFAGMADFMRNMNMDRSPVLCMEAPPNTTYDENGWEYHDYVLYFCVRADHINDGRSTDKAYEEAESHWVQLKEYIQSSMRELIADGKHPELSRVNTTGVGPIWDGWYALQVPITVGEGYCRKLDNALLRDASFADDMLNVEDNDVYGD